MNKLVWVVSVLLVVSVTALPQKKGGRVVGADELVADSFHPMALRLHEDRRRSRRQIAALPTGMDTPMLRMFTRMENG